MIKYLFKGIKSHIEIRTPFITKMNNSIYRIIYNIPSRWIQTKAMRFEQAIGSIIYNQKYKEQRLAKQETKKLIAEHDGKFPNPIEKLTVFENIYQGLNRHHQQLRIALFDSKKDKINADIHEYKVTRAAIALLRVVFNHRIRNRHKMEHPMEYIVTMLQILKHYRKMHLINIYDALIQMINRQNYKYRKWFITRVLLSNRLDLAPQLSCKGANDLLREYINDFRIKIHHSGAESHIKKTRDLLLDILQFLHLYGDYQLDFTPRTLLYIQKLRNSLLLYKDPFIQKILYNISSKHE